MVYKKYLKKGGKSFGPYYYESFRQGNEVKKKYIGGEKEYQIWLNKNKKDGKKVEQLVVISKKTFNLGILLFFLSLIILVFIIGVNLGYFFNVSGIFATGFAISENVSSSGDALLYGNYEDEVVVEQFDTEKVDLEIKEPPKFSGEALTKNKNKRMEFNTPDGNIRLYFDLLDYSEFVDEINNLVEQDKADVLREKQNQEKKADKSGLYKKVEENVNTTTETSSNETQTSSDNANETEEQIEENITEQVSEIPEQPVKTTEGIPFEEPEAPAEEPAPEPVAEPEPEAPITGGAVAVEKGKNILEKSIKYSIGFFIKVFEKIGITGKVVEGVNESEAISEINIKTTTEEPQTTAENNSNNDLITNADNTNNLSEVIESEVSSESFVTNTGSETTSITQTTSTSSEAIKSEDIKDKIEELDKAEIKDIEEQAKVVVEDFKVNVSKAEDNNYKWGYKVKLNSLDFMAKIDVTSEQNIFVYNEDTLRIGNQLLSFADLVKAGYTVRIEKPALDIHISVDTISMSTTSTSSESSQTETTEILTDESEKTTSEINETETINTNINESGEVEGISNETTEAVVENREVIEGAVEEPTGITGNIIKSFSKVFYAFGGLTGRVVDDTNTFEIEKTEIADIEYENTITIYIEKDFNEKSSSLSDNTETQTDNIQTQTAETTSDNFDINNNSDNIINNGGGSLESEGGVSEQAENNEQASVNENSSLITGNVIAEEEAAEEISENDLSDIKYEDVDGDGKISVGDIIELDPTLTYIYISKAEHLDANRNYLSDIYEDVKEQDGNWSEIIRNNEYVRVTFEQNLTKEKDITFYGRSTNNCSINPDGSIVINGESVPCDIYEKKKRVDEIRRLLEE